MKSIKWKLIAMYLGLVFIVMIVSGTYILLSLQNIEIEKAREQLLSYSEKITEQVVLSYDEVGYQSGLEQFSNTTSDSQLQGNILNSKGETIASTTVSKPPYPEYKSSVIISALAGEAEFTRSDRAFDSSGGEHEWLSYARPVVINNETKYIIYARMDATSMKESLLQTQKTIVVSVLLALLLTICMGYIFANTLTGPILVLTAKAKELADGNLEQRIDVKSDDEIGQLTLSFNDMAAKLMKTMLETKSEKNKLEIILHNMTDGVVSFDKYGQIIHVNTAALEMLEKDSLDYSFTDFIKEFNISSSVYLDIGPDFSKQIIFPIGKKYINASFSPNINERNEMDGLVVVLQDITEQKKLDDMRKEFVANVSHELRTPLTTVKSYIETLIDGAIDDRETAMDFLNIVESEADRMTFLVQDLLQLSRFDNKQVVLNITKFELNQFIKDNLRQSRILADKKDQYLYFVPYDNDVHITADADRIKQVINNIVSNAIKYSLNQAEIKVYIGEDSKYYKVFVKDTGMGIQREDLPRIFERFYRVDKARSRAMGGTGLGLAIAKEIMESHGGKITVESEYGKGTTMTLWFLKNMDLRAENDREIVL